MMLRQQLPIQKAAKEKIPINFRFIKDLNVKIELSKHQKYYIHKNCFGKEIFFLNEINHAIAALENINKLDYIKIKNSVPQTSQYEELKKNTLFNRTIVFTYNKYIIIFKYHNWPGKQADIGGKFNFTYLIINLSQPLTD